MDLCAESPSVQSAPYSPYVEPPFLYAEFGHDDFKYR
jgi:hypothetical protein